MNFINESIETYNKTGDLPNGARLYYVKTYGMQKDKHGVAYENHPRIGVVIIGKGHDGKYCRGISVCSTKDAFNRVKGTIKALARWASVASTGIHGDSCTGSAPQMAGSMRRFNEAFGEEVMFLSEHDVKLTRNERTILKEG